MAKKIITVKDRDLEKLKEENGRLESRLSIAETELEEIKTKGLGEELAKAQANVEKYKQEKERLKIDLEKAKKVFNVLDKLSPNFQICSLCTALFFFYGCVCVFLLTAKNTQIFNSNTMLF